MKTWFQKFKREGADLNIVGLGVIALSALFYIFSEEGVISENLYLRGANLGEINRDSFICVGLFGFIMIILHYAWLGRKQELIKRQWSHILYKHYSKYYLTVISGGIAAVELWIELNENEKAAYYKNGPKFIDELASKIAQNPSTYKKRAIKAPF